MSEKWILDVIADLQSFARANEMPVLGHHLETTKAIAEAELAVRSMQTNSKLRGSNPMHILTTRVAGSG